jgi:hypothetical protein
MEHPRGLLHNDEVVLDASSFDEGALVGLDQLRNPRSQPGGEKLGDKLAETVDEAVWPKIFHLYPAIDLGEEGEESGV